MLWDWSQWRAFSTNTHPMKTGRTKETSDGKGKQRISWKTERAYVGIAAQLPLLISSVSLS